MGAGELPALAAARTRAVFYSLIDQCMNNTIKDEDEKDQTVYRKMRKAITGGEFKRLPYNEYVLQRAIYFIKELANPAELALIEYAIKERNDADHQLNPIRLPVK